MGREKTVIVNSSCLQKNKASFYVPYFNQKEVNKISFSLACYKNRTMKNKKQIKRTIKEPREEVPTPPLHNFPIPVIGCPTCVGLTGKCGSCNGSGGFSDSGRSTTNN